MGNKSKTEKGLNSLSHLCPRLLTGLGERFPGPVRALYHLSISLPAPSFTISCLACYIPTRRSFP